MFSSNHASAVFSQTSLPEAVCSFVSASFTAGQSDSAVVPASVTPAVLSAWFAAAPATRVLDKNFLPSQVGRMPRPVARVASAALKINGLLPLFNTLPPALGTREFSSAVLRSLGITLNIEGDLQSLVPATGPLVVVSNHPFGGLDGVALLAALLPHRPDLKMLINTMLGVFPDLRESCLPLDVFGGKEAMSRNMSSLRLAGAHLKQGGAVGIFPSGTVSHWQKGKGVVDPEWQTTVARLAMRHNATVLPVHFAGSNSAMFSLMGLLHPLARTLMLPREILRRKGQHISMRVGRPIDPATIKMLGSAEAATTYFRMRSYSLGSRRVFSVPQQVERPMEPVAPSHSAQSLAAAVAALPEDCLLLREGKYAIYSVFGTQSPLLLEELGSLREHTFRLVGEGSGKARDLDNYDARYHHILLWNEEDSRLAGAYRLGKVSDLLHRDGPKGLYTSTLFRMNKHFFHTYGNALELGRAVVHPDYQREYAPLLLLWKGIGQFLLRHDAHYLFGPVSIPLDYSPASLRTVVDYLRGQCGSAGLSSQVQGRTRPDRLLSRAAGILLPESLSYNNLVSLVRDMEGGRGIPILFKHYLKLGGKIGAFHMDTAFNSLDAFLFMDLADAPRPMLDRYLGVEGASGFVSKWKGKE